MHAPSMSISVDYKIGKPLETSRTYHRIILSQLNQLTIINTCWDRVVEEKFAIFHALSLWASCCEWTIMTVKVETIVTSDVHRMGVAMVATTIDGVVGVGFSCPCVKELVLHVE